MKRVVFTEADWRAPLTQSHSWISNKCELNFKQFLGKKFII